VANPGEPPLSRNREFTLLWSGQVLSVLGTRVSWVAYPLLVLSLTHSPIKTGVVSFATWIPAVVLGLPSGVIVDRWDRRKLMIACESGRADACGGLVATLATGTITYGQIIAVSVIERSFATLFDPAEVGAVRNLVTQSQLTTALARNESRQYVAFLLGPPLGGALFGIARLLPFLFDALSYSASVLALLLIKRPFQTDVQRERMNLVPEMREGFIYMWHQPFLRTTTLLGAAADFVTNGIGLATIIIAKQSLHATPTDVGGMLAIAGAGGLIGSLATPLIRLKLSPRLVVVGATTCWALVIPTFLLTTNAYTLGALLAVALATAPPWNAVISTYRIALIPDHFQGRVESAHSLFSLGAIALGTLMAGLLLGTLGRASTVGVFTMVMAGVAAVSIWSPSIRRCLADS